MQASVPEGKIGAVAKALRAALLASGKGQAHFLRPILTSHAVLGDLDGALTIIKHVKESQLATEGAWHSRRSHGKASSAFPGD